MAISEEQLETWSHQGSITQSSATYNTIKTALKSSNAPYAGKGYEIFLQGSYGNDTNIYKESDVDILIVLKTAFTYDIEDLDGNQQAAFKSVYSSNAPYGYSAFKKDVQTFLRDKYGNSIKEGNKAIHIEANGNRRKADVIIALKHRRYNQFSSATSEHHETGISFYAADNTKIYNYPKQHSTNCTAKHKVTAEWFKPMVRILKNMRSKMIEQKVIEANLAPSYYIEGLLYNVPNDKFGNSYTDSFIKCINWLINIDRKDLLCANEQYYLLRDNSPVTWRDADCTKFLTALCNLWKQW